jgi:cystathionine beta-lyase
MMDELYGGTHAFAGSEFPRLGIDCSFTATDADSVCKAKNSKTKLVVIESPTNPLLSVIDIKKVASFARKKKVLTVIDNTFATPLHQNPLALGIDVVVHSGTKYLGGHSDICCGIAVTSRKLTARIRKTALNFGGSLNAQTCALLERSLMTLAIRVGRQTENAGRVARYLEKNSKVKRVNYPGIKSSAYHKLAKKQMEGFGAMLSFEVDPSKVDPVRFIRALRVIKPAVSLGGIESTICAPAVTSHAKISDAERCRIGISDALLRLSVGIEQADDLIEDIEQAMNA